MVRIFRSSALLLGMVAVFGCASTGGEAGGAATESITVSVQHNNPQYPVLTVSLRPQLGGASRLMGDVRSGATGTYRVPARPGTYTIIGEHSGGTISSEDFVVTGPGSVSWVTMTGTTRFTAQ